MLIPILAAALAVLTILQVWTRLRHRARAGQLRARLAQVQRESEVRIEQSGRQIAQLQSELGAARLQLRQLAKKDLAPVPDKAAARRALERELDQAADATNLAAVDGFADTQVSTDDTHHGSLLLQ